MYKNFIQIIVYLQLFNLCLNFKNFSIPTINQPVVEKPTIEILDYCQLVQIETKNLYESKKTLGQGSFGAVKEIDDEYVVKIQEIPLEVDKNQKSKSLSTKEQLDDEIYFLNIVKEKLKEQNYSQTLQDKFLILQKCEIYISEEENKYYYYQILKKYQADLEYKYGQNYVAISRKGLDILHYMQKAEELITIKKRFLQMAIDLFQQLEFLHNNNLVHGDIKADNILVKSPISLDQMIDKTYGPNFYDDDYSLTFTIGDYGLTRYEFEQIKLINLTSTHPALQMSIQTQKYAIRQSDIYSMAITILTALQYKEGQVDVLTYRDILYSNVYQEISKYKTDELDETFKQSFINLKQRIRRDLQLQDQGNLCDCYSLGCVLYYSFAHNMMSHIPSASRILKYLYKISNRLDFTQFIVRNKQKFNFSYTFQEIEEQLFTRCNINFQNQGQNQFQNYHSRMPIYINRILLSNLCNASLTVEAFKFKQNHLSNMPENTAEQLQVITSKSSYFNWIDSLIYYDNMVGELQDFLNYDYYAQADIQESKVLFGFLGSNVDRELFLYTFYYFDFEQNQDQRIPKKIQIDEQSKITSNFINLFDGIKRLQKYFLVYQNINPSTIVQTTYFESLKDLNLKMLALPIYEANKPFVQENYQLLFTYPLQNSNYYNYQADTYSMSLTCIYIIFQIYTQNPRRKIDEQLLSQLDRLQDNRLGFIQQIIKNIENTYKIVFGDDIKRTNNCLTINQFPENLICVLKKQVSALVEQIEDPNTIIQQIQEIQNNLGGNNLRRSMRVQLKYNYILFLIQIQEQLFIFFSLQKQYILKHHLNIFYQFDYHLLILLYYRNIQQKNKILNLIFLKTMDIKIENFNELCNSTKNLDDLYRKYHTKCKLGRVTDIAVVSYDPLKIITCSQKGNVQIWEFDVLGNLDVEPENEFDWKGNDAFMKQIVMSQDRKKFYILLAFDKKEHIIVFENNKYSEQELVFEHDNLIEGTIQLSDCGMYLYYFDGQGTLYKINDIFAIDFKIEQISTQQTVKGAQKNSDQFLGKRFLMFEDRKILVSDSHGNLAIHRIKDGKFKQGNNEIYSEHNVFITYMQLNKKKNKLVTCSKDGCIVVWKFPEMSVIFSKHAHKESINQVKFHPSKSWIFSCSKDHTVRAWCLKSQNEIRQMRLEGHTDEVQDFEFLSDNQIITCSSDKSMKLWDLNLLQDLISRRITCEQYSIKHVTQDINQKNFIVSAVNEETKNQVILKINKKTKVQDIIYEGDKQVFKRISIKKSQKEIIASTSKTIIKTIDIESQKEQRDNTYDTGSDIRSNIEIDNEKQKFYVGLKNGCVQCWDLNKQKKYFEFKAHKSKVRYIQLTYDKKFLYTCGDDQLIRKWNIETKKEVEGTKMEGHNSIIYKIWINHDDTLLYSCSDDSTIRIWDLETHDEIEELCMTVDQEESITDIYVTKNESLLISCSKHNSNNLYILGYWNLDTGKNISEQKIEYQEGDLIQVLMDKEEEYVYAIFSDKILTYDYKYQKQIDRSLLFMLKSSFSKQTFTEDQRNQLIGYLKYQKNIFNFSSIPLILCVSGNYDFLSDYVINFGVSNYSCHVIQTLIKSIQKLKKYKKKKKKKNDFAKQISSQQSYSNKVKNLSSKTLSNKSLSNKSLTNKCTKSLTKTKKKEKKGYIGISGNEDLFEHLKESFKKIIATLSTEDVKHSKITSYDMDKLLNSRQYKDQTALIFLKYFKKLSKTVQTQLEYSYENSIEFNPRLSNEKTNYESLTDDSEFVKEEDYYLYETQFGVDIRNGSMYSIRLFEILEEANFEVIHTLVSIINIKWNNVYYKLLIQLCVYICLTTFINTAYIWEEKSVLFSLLSLPFLIALAFFEFLTFITCGKKYFTFYNICDVLIFGQLFLFIWFNYSGLKTKEKYFFDILTILISNLKFVLELRFFEELRYLIAMVLNVAKDVAGFTILAGCFTYIYAAMIYGSDRFYSRPAESFGHKLTLAVDMALGSYEMETNQWQALDWLIFIFSVITLTIVMLNLIIAIVGNTFNTYQEGRERFDLQEKIGMILDFDRFWYNFMKFKKLKIKDYSFYQILEKKTEEEDERHMKLEKIIKKQDKISEKLIESFQQIQDSIQTLQEHVDDQKKDFQGLKNIQNEAKNTLKESHKQLEKVHNHFFKPRASQLHKDSYQSMSRSSSFKPQQFN